MLVYNQKQLQQEDTDCKYLI